LFRSLALWHGFTPALQLSLLALAAGGTAYAVFRRYLADSPDEGPPWAGRLRARRVFDLALTGLVRGAAAGLRWLGTTGWRPQMRLLPLVPLAAARLRCALRPARGAGWLPPGGALRTDPRAPACLVVWVLGGAFALLTAYLAKFHRFAALITLAGTGLAMVLTFVWLSAPDLALTQLVVEVTTTVLLLLGLGGLPRPVPA